MKTMLLGGFGVDVRLGANLSSRACRGIRIALMLLLACDLSLFAGLWLNEAAIDASIAKSEFSQNAAALQKGMRDWDVKRDAALKNYETALASQKSVSPEVTRLIQQSNRSTSSRIADRLTSNEARLDKINAKVVEAANALEAVDATRTAELEKLRKSPGWIPRDESLIARIQALFDEITSRPLAALGMAFIGLVILGTDLIVLTLKGIGMPSAYAMMDTRRHLGLMVEQANRAQAETATRESAPPLAPQRHEAAGPPEVRTNAPRRGPGRPLGSRNKKHLNGHGEDQRHG